MTTNERMVWAAVFAKHFTGKDDDTPTAAEEAWGAVETLRQHYPLVADHFGVDDDVTRMFEETGRGESK